VQACKATTVMRLLLNVLETQAQLVQVGHKTILGNRAKGAGRKPNADGTSEFRDENALLLYVRSLHVPRLVIRVRDPVSRKRPLSCEFAYT